MPCLCLNLAAEKKKGVVQYQIQKVLSIALLFLYLFSCPILDLFVSEVYQKDFDGIKTKFLSLHLRISKILANSGHVTLENLKELLAFYSYLEGPLQAAETITSVMRIVQQHSTVINCSYLEHIAEHFNLPDVSKEIDAYCKLVDEFCQ